MGVMLSVRRKMRGMSRMATMLIGLIILLEITMRKK